MSKNKKDGDRHPTVRCTECGEPMRFFGHDPHEAVCRDCEGRPPGSVHERFWAALTQRQREKKI